MGIFTNTIFPTAGERTGEGNSNFGGGIIQVQSRYKSDKYSTTSTSYTDVSNLHVNITTASSTSKVLLLGCLRIGSGAGNSDTDEHMVVFANYAFGMATVGVSAAQVDHGAAAKESETAMAFGIAVNINDNLSVSYGEREIEHSKAGSEHIDEEISGFAVAYTMGAAKITAQQNETKDNGGTKGSDDESTQIALSLSF